MLTVARPPYTGLSDTRLTRHRLFAIEKIYKAVLRPRPTLRFAK